MKGFPFYLRLNSVVIFQKEVDALSDMTQEKVKKQENRKIGLISMGITLVVAGAVMLLQELEWVDFSGYRWLLPAYMVTLGVETLVTRLLLNRKAPDTRLSPAAGSVAVTLVVLLFVRLWNFFINLNPHLWYRW